MTKKLAVLFLVLSLWTGCIKHVPTPIPPTPDPYDAVVNVNSSFLEGSIVTASYETEREDDDNYVSERTVVVLDTANGREALIFPDQGNLAGFFPATAKVKIEYIGGQHSAKFVQVVVE